MNRKTDACKVYIDDDDDETGHSVRSKKIVGNSTWSLMPGMPKAQERLKTQSSLIRLIYLKIKKSL